MTSWLAIDTATDAALAAIGPRGGPAVAEIALSDRRHAAALLPAITELLRLGGVSWDALEGVIVADGPGSFTGLRIGFATALGIVQVHRRLPVHTAPSLLAAAWGVRHFTDGPVAALYDALRGEVFAAVYGFSTSGVETLVPPMLGSLDAVIRAAPRRPRLVVGDGGREREREVREWCGRDPALPPLGGPRAGALLELLDVPGGAVAIPEPAHYEPHYGRKAEAQVRWEEAHQRSLPDPRRAAE